jgi:LysM repeat protein
VVRQGDNLVSIAHYFGVPLKVVQERNPWTDTTPLVAGQKLLLPPPTR